MRKTINSYKMKINFFNEQSGLYPYRWLIITTTALMLFLAWHNLNGGRIFTSNGSQQWSSSGPGSHK